ncbi:hypothetical protein LXL04_016549 [Taraxacum kok-saghyz]
MSSSKVTGIGMMIQRHNLLYASRPALFASGDRSGRLYFESDSNTRSESEGNTLKDTAEKTVGTVIGGARNTGEKVKDEVMGTGGSTAHPSKDPEQNHGVEKTDSSCEDVRDRPGGYS